MTYILRYKIGAGWIDSYDAPSKEAIDEFLQKYNPQWFEIIPQPSKAKNQTAKIEH